jgi:hypothetical protein
MKLSTLPRFLVGSRSAIEEVASSPAAVLCGVLLVISAGLAREYDGEDLLHEPWHVLRPLAASLLSGSLLFLIVNTAANARSGKADADLPPLWPTYRAFMAVFWMTAPLAWLYAIPCERFLSPADAVAANLWTLAVVSVWRVLLITRCISVLYSVSAVGAFFVVMLFADVVAFLLVAFMPKPVIEVMGGLRHTERDALVLSVTFAVIFWSVVTIPAWLVGAIIAIRRFKPDLSRLTAADRTPRPAWITVATLGAITVLMWTPALLVGQPEQIRKRRAEDMLRSGAIAEAFREMSAHRRGDYPPYWEPPPRLAYRERTPSLEDVRAAMEQEWPAGWVADMYVDKIHRRTRQRLLPHVDWSWSRIEEHLGSVSREVAAESADTIRFLLQHDASLSDEDRAAMERLVEEPADP